MTRLGKGEDLYWKADVGKQLIILSGRDQGDSAGKAGKIAEFMGIPHIKISQGIKNPEKIIDENLLGRKKACIIVSTHTLGKVFDTTQRRENLIDTISREEQVLFLYGVSDSPAETELVKQLTNSSIIAARNCYPSRLKCKICSEASSICPQLSSVSFEVDVDPNTSTFSVEKNIWQGEVLATLDGEPFFMRAAVGQGEVFVAGCSRIADVEERVTQRNYLLQYFTSLAPLMMVLRHVYPAESWHNAMPRACFIIDDPLLRKLYGFLDYQKILKIMEEKRFCTSIAFIPWNYNRTNKDVALLFQEHGDKFSLSVHGCDHTRAEFGSTNKELLQQKANEALKRMMLHQNLSGLPFERVMVFPQGIFSTVALEALKSSGYMAAVNSTLYPINAEDKILSLREILDVAVTKFSNLPIFIRRYPNNLAESAFDLFLGKPVLLVEHHKYFKDGYRALTEVVDEVNSFDSRLEWSSLEKICSQASLKRRSENGEIHVRFFTDQFNLRNDSACLQNYILFRRNMDADHLIKVTINGRLADYLRETEWLKIPISLDPGQNARVSIQCEKSNRVAIPLKQNRIEKTRVSTRRRLCEFRDNYIDKYWSCGKAVDK